MSYDLDDLGRRMDGAVEALHKDLAGLRTGRASPELLAPVMVNAYGSPTPLPQVASVSAPEARLLSVQVWDQSQAAVVEKGIRDSGLGLNPIREGAVIRIPLPDLNEERRNELSRVAAKYAEQARVAVRNVRRDGMDQLKKLEKDGDISKDDARTEGDKVQKLTDEHIKLIDDSLAQKDAEIRQV